MSLEETQCAWLGVTRNSKKLGISDYLNFDLMIRCCSKHPMQSILLQLTECRKDLEYPMRSIKSPRTVWTYLFVVAFGSRVISRSLLSSGPPLRTGLWVTQPIVSGRKVSAFEAQVRANPHLSGVCLHMGWKDIEKEPGQFDFSAIDKAVAVLRRIGMKYELGIKPGFATPAFLYQQGAQSFETQVQNPHRPNFGAAVTIPVPWDPKYQRSFSRLDYASWRTLRF